YVKTDAPKSIQDACDPNVQRALKVRRNELLKSMPRFSNTTAFDLFIRELGLDMRYRQFVDNNRSLFEYLPSLSPRVQNKAVHFDKKKDGTNSYEPKYAKATQGITRHEPKLVACFLELLNAMSRKVELSNAPNSLYKYKDHQNSDIGDTGLRPDIAFYLEDDVREAMGAIHMVLEAKIGRFPGSLDSDDLGQILDYVQDIWKTQITRKFVPVLFLHGELLSLFVFYRNKFVRVDLGQVFCDSENPNSRKLALINATLMKLHFLLMLPPGDFGHICDFAEPLSLLYFLSPYSVTVAVDEQSVDPTNKGKSVDDGVQVEPALATVSARNEAGSVEFIIDNMLERDVSLQGRIACIVNGQLEGRMVVLKLSWTAENRLPENALYDILLRNQIKGVPEMRSRGLICRGFHGYRLEYMVMDNCGVSLSKALENIHSMDNVTFFTDAVKSIISQVTACLVSAFAVGIVHRDISDGNIAVKVEVGQVDARVIDWGYAKDANWNSDSSKNVGQRWCYDSAKIGKNEEAHDPFTGTPKYMSICALFGNRYRNAFTDIESLFYVVLDALRGIYGHSKTGKDPAGFSFHKKLVILGHIRVSCLLSEDNWLANFGINKADIPLDLLNVLQAMRRFLFFENGTYVGSHLADEPQYMYCIDKVSARLFMDEDTLSLLVEDGLHTGAQLTQTIVRVSPTKRADVPASSQAEDIQSSPTRPPKRKIDDKPENSKRQQHTTSNQEQKGNSCSDPFR
ncbi:hypothetical protein H4R99_006833, partial [Coemansia sp. RSA 1722]